MRLHYSLAAFSLVASVSASASADVITDWNIVAIDTARATGNPNPATRVVAIAHLAAYDAVNAINKTGEKYLPGTIAVTSPASVDAAAVRAFHDALVFAVPSKKVDVDKAAEKALAKLEDGPAKSNGIAVGAAAAAALVAARSGDGSETPGTYPGEETLGKWRPTPTLLQAANTPEWATLKTFGLTAQDQFDPGAPPALNSGAYATAVLETKLYGAKTGSLRTAEETNIANFWAQQTHLPFFQLARTFSKSKELSVDENARFFGQLALALADARIATWNAKYKYGFWRPVTSINSQLDDGNPDTTPDAEGDWLPLLETPNHPEYPSGHSATGAAGATVLAAWFGEKNSFAVTSETLVGAAYTRSFTSFSDAAQENAESRIYGGIHYRFSNEAGLGLGEKVADYVLANKLKAFPTPVNGEGGAGGEAGAASGGNGAAGEPEPVAGAPATSGTGGIAGTETGGTGGAAAGTAGAGTTAGTAGKTDTPQGDAGQTAAEGGAPSSGGASSKAGSSSSGSESDDSGCSISSPATSPTRGVVVALLAMGAVWLRRRQRRN
jgi:MYXO-CTERM domain-containing protein